MVLASEAGVTGSGSVLTFGASGDGGWAMGAILAVHGGGFTSGGLEEITTFGTGRVGRIPCVDYGEEPESLSVSVNVEKPSDTLLSSTGGGGLTVGIIFSSILLGYPVEASKIDAKLKRAIFLLDEEDRC